MLTKRNRNLKTRSASRDIARLLLAFKDGDPGDGGSGGEDDATKQAVADLKGKGFTVMRQEEFNNLMRKERTTAENKFTAKITDLESQVAGLKDQADGKAKDTISKVEHERLLGQKDADIKTRDERITGLTGFQKKAALMEAAGRAGVVKTAYGDVAELLGGKVHVEADGSLTVVDEKGDRLTGKSGFMTVDELVSGYVSEKPYLKEASPNAGAGSGTAKSGGSTGGNPKPPEHPAGMELVSTGG